MRKSAKLQLFKYVKRIDSLETKDTTICLDDQKRDVLIPTSNIDTSINYFLVIKSIKVWDEVRVSGGPSLFFLPLYGAARLLIMECKYSFYDAMSSKIIYSGEIKSETPSEKPYININTWQKSVIDLGSYIYRKTVFKRKPHL